MKQKKVSIITISVLTFVVLYLFVINPKFSFQTQSKVIVKTAEEWELSKTLNGNITTSFKDHITNSTKNYSITEFQRGDAIQFVLNDKVFNKSRIDKGDTIGYIYSNEEKRNLIRLKGDLKILYAELEFFTTG